MKCERFSFKDTDYGQKIDGYVIIADDEIVVTYCAYGRICTKKYEDVVEMAKDITLYRTKKDILKDLLRSESDRADQLEDILEDLEIVELLDEEE